MDFMTFFRSLLLVCPAACLLAQTPPPASRPATPIPPPTPPAQTNGQSNNGGTGSVGTGAVGGAPKAAPGQPITLSLPIPPPLPKVAPDKVILTVGSMNLTAEQFDQIIDSVPEQYKAFFKGPGRKQFADQIVKVLVLAQEGQRRKLDEKPAFKTQALFQADNVLASATVAEINQSTKLDESELRKYYEDHKSDFEQLHARHILVRMKGSPVPVKPGQPDLTEAEALNKAQDILKRLKAGEDFAKLAETESDDVGSAANGGDLPSFAHGRMVPSFEEAAYKLQPGQISDPVKSQFGYHIIKLESRQAKTFEEARPEIEQKLKPEQVKKVMDDLEKNTKVVYDPEFFQLAKQ
jgi:peptidyl-prolyl cis-trans isomerase C